MEAIFIKSCQGATVENKKGFYSKECGQGREDAFREGCLSQDLKWGSLCKKGVEVLGKGEQHVQGP